MANKMRTCPICNGTDYTILGKARYNSISEKFITADYRVVRCSQCTGYYVTPPITFTDEQWSALYHDEYFAGQSEWLLKKRSQELKQRLDFALSLIDSDNEIHLLDIGTGEGRTLIEADRRGWKTTGIDVVDNRIADAKHESIHFIKAKFLEYPLPLGAYDIIYLDSVLEHVLQPGEYIARIKELLKPGGVLFIAVPNEDSLFNDIRKIAYRLTRQSEITEKIKPFDSPYHIIGFTEHSLNSIVHSHGLYLHTLRNIGRKMNFLGENIFSRMFWIKFLILFPIEILGQLINRDEYFEAYVKKMDNN